MDDKFWIKLFTMICGIIIIAFLITAFVITASWWGKALLVLFAIIINGSIILVLNYKGD